MPTVAVGDIHGNLPALADLLTRLRGEVGHDDVVVFLGDYVRLCRRTHAARSRLSRNAAAQRGRHGRAWVPLFNARTMEERLQLTLGNARFNTLLLTILGAIGVVPSPSLAGTPEGPAPLRRARPWRALMPGAQPC